MKGKCCAPKLPLRWKNFISWPVEFAEGFSPENLKKGTSVYDSDRHPHPPNFAKLHVPKDERIYSIWGFVGVSPQIFRENQN